MVNKLFDSWTWNRALPEPFDSIAKKVRTDVWSKYNLVTTKKSTLHAATLAALFTYMDIDNALSKPPGNPSAIGTQDNLTVAEYESHTGEIHTVIFNANNGKFFCGRFDTPEGSPKVYTIKDKGNTGTALLFALIPAALDDDEFKDYYYILANERYSGYPNMESAAKAAFILCDNLYRRINDADSISGAGISTNIPTTGNIGQITAINLNKGTYIPTNVLYGEFRILTPKSMKPFSVTISNTGFEGKYAFEKRSFSKEEQTLIPTLPKWYIIPPQIESICKHAKVTGDRHMPMRNFMLRGSAGTGKTEGAKAIAAGLGLPYLSHTCSANDEVYDFLGQMLPATDNDSSLGVEYPTFEDIQMDPPTAYFKLTGEYIETINETDVYDKLLSVIKSNSKDTSKQQFQFIETPLIKAIRNGYVIEIQETAVISNPGVLVGLNSLMDLCASVTLPNGETVRRHPDAVIVITTNNNYAGCRDMNQSIISRMNMIFDMEEPDAETIVKRVSGITGCTDVTAVTDMTAAMLDMKEHCQETMISDGSCGIRELISWVQSYMITNDIMESAACTILSSASSDPENRADILSTCLESKFQSAA